MEPDTLRSPRSPTPHTTLDGIISARVRANWAAEQGLTWDVTPSESGDRWGCRLETYLTDPREEPDMSKWVTQLAFRLAE